MSASDPPKGVIQPDVSAGGLINAPNLLSASRVPLGVAFWYVVEYPLGAVAVLLLAGLTDMLDGILARRAQVQSPFGAIIDPVCDKLFMLLVLISMVWSEHIDLRQLALLMTREWLIVPLALGTHLIDARSRARLTMRSNYFGKATTVCQFFALCAALSWRGMLPSLVALSALLGLIAIASYVTRGLREVWGAPLTHSV